MYKLRLPVLGQTMESGTIQNWLKNEGEAIAAGESLYEVESDKATVVVEANRDGTLRKILVGEGDEVSVGAVLAVVAEVGEVLTDEDVELAAREEPAAVTAAAPVTAAPSTAPPPHAPGARVRATPRARAAAGRLGVDLSQLTGSGTGGTIVAEDVERAVVGGVEPAVLERRPLRGIPRAMAEAMSRSWAEVPQFVQQVWADASGLARMRKRESDAVGTKVSYTDLLLDVVVEALRQVPSVNARFGGDEIVVYEDMNISVAIGTDAGLVVPVIRRAQAMALAERAVALRELADRARSGHLAPDDLVGGTITVSNLGMHGVETGLPLVTAPQAAIVFVGATIDRPVAVDGRVEIRPTIGLAVGFDHRVVDGVEAARFTTALKRIVESN